MRFHLQVQVIFNLSLCYSVSKILRIQKKREITLKSRFALGTLPTGEYLPPHTPAPSGGSAPWLPQHPVCVTYTYQCLRTPLSEESVSWATGSQREGAAWPQASLYLHRRMHLPILQEAYEGGLLNESVKELTNKCHRPKKKINDVFTCHFYCCSQVPCLLHSQGCCSSQKVDLWS